MGIENKKINDFSSNDTLYVENGLDNVLSKDSRIYSDTKIKGLEMAVTAISNFLQESLLYNTNALTYNANISINERTSYKIGNAVIVNIRFLCNANISAYSDIFSGLPAPVVANLPFATFDATDQSQPPLFLSSTGVCMNASQLTSGHRYSLALVYFTVNN